MQTRSYGNLPPKACLVTLARIAGEPYRMTLKSEDAEWATEAINQGIDSHLEACMVPTRGDSYSYTGGLDLRLSAESLAVFLRRLTESWEDHNMDLASSILWTLGVEWV